MKQRKKLMPGRYRAATDVTVNLIDRGNVVRSSVNIKAGVEFDVPPNENGLWTAMVWHPDFGTLRPKVEQLGEVPSGNG